MSHLASAVLGLALGLGIGAAVDAYNVDRLISANIDLRASSARCLADQARSSSGRRLEADVRLEPVEPIPGTWRRFEVDPGDGWRPVFLVAQPLARDDGVWWEPL